MPLFTPRKPDLKANGIKVVPIVLNGLCNRPVFALWKSVLVTNSSSFTCLCAMLQILVLQLEATGESPWTLNIFGCKWWCKLWESWWRFIQLYCKLWMRKRDFQKSSKRELAMQTLSFRASVCLIGSDPVVESASRKLLKPWPLHVSSRDTARNGQEMLATVPPKETTEIGQMNSTLIWVNHCL